MEKPRARLKDVAQATGFSVNTVSLALRSSRRIPQATSALILEAARRLDYVPNRAARSLVSHSSGAVGLVLTDLGDPSQASAARAIDRRLAEAGYSMILAESDHSVDDEIAAVEALRSHQVDGLLIYPADHGRIAHLRRWRAAGQSIVFLRADRHAGVDIAAVDDRLGAFKATAHLAALGHRRIAFFDSGAPPGNREKFDGYRDALVSHDLALDLALALDPLGHSAGSGYEAMARLMAIKPRPTALVRANRCVLRLGRLLGAATMASACPKSSPSSATTTSKSAAVRLASAHFGELRHRRRRRRGDRTAVGPRASAKPQGASHAD